MTVIEQIVSGEYAHKHYYEHYHSHTSVAFCLLHSSHVRCDCIVGTTIAEQLDVNGVVVRIKAPVAQSQSSHSRLITNVENSTVIGFHTIAKPLQFGCDGRVIAVERHQSVSSGCVRDAFGIQFVEQADAAVGKYNSTLILPIDVAVVGAIGISSGFGFHRCDISQMSG